RAADRGHREVRESDRVDDHHRNVEFFQFGAEFGVQVCGDENRAVAGPGADVLEPFPGGAGLAVDGGHGYAAVHAVRGSLDSADDLHCPRAVQVVEDQVDEADPLAAALSVAAAPPAAVSAEAEQVFDAFAGLGCYIASSVEDARDRRRGHTRPCRDCGGPHGSARCLGHASSFSSVSPYKV